MYKKPIIVFEGIEGSGKTSHINFISNYFKKKGIKHIKIREPGGSKNSEKIRNLMYCSFRVLESNKIVATKYLTEVLDLLLYLLVYV